MYICVDFDGTIVKHDFPKIGKPLPHAIEWLLRFHQAGGKIILFTMRSGHYLEEAVEYLRTKKVPLFGINHNPTQKTWTSSPKAFGNVYIDDLAFGCPMKYYDNLQTLGVDWATVGPAVLAEIKSRGQK